MIIPTEAIEKKENKFIPPKPPTLWGAVCFKSRIEKVWLRENGKVWYH